MCVIIILSCINSILVAGDRLLVVCVGELMKQQSYKQTCIYVP